MPLTNRSERIINQVLIPAIVNLGGTVPQPARIGSFEDYQFQLLSAFVTALINAVSLPTALQVNAEPAGTMATHCALADPHSQYATDADLSAHSGAASPHSGHATNTALTNHTGNTSNPHSTTAAQVNAEPTGAVAVHAVIASNVHGLPASVNVLGNRNAAGEFVQRGSATASGSLGTLALAQYRDIAITFPNAFTSVPKVFATSASGYPAGVLSVSVTGCTIRVFGELAFAASTVVNYLAIGA